MSERRELSTYGTRWLILGIWIGAMAAFLSYQHWLGAALYAGFGLVVLLPLAIWLGWFRKGDNEN